MKTTNPKTKCRKCGEINEYESLSTDKTVYNAFLKTGTVYVQTPRECYCKKCKKDTVQDIIDGY